MLENTIIFVLNCSEFDPVLSFLDVGGYCFLNSQLILTHFLDVLSFGVV